jgi:dienelactone hydrolase
MPQERIISDFESYDHTAHGYTHAIYVIGGGAPVIVMHELPGIGKAIVDFSRRLVDEGFQVHLPHLFGILGKKQAIRNYRQLCVSAEFGRLAAGVSAPITCWLRCLAERISRENHHCKVGAIGMCLTGGFAIPLAIDPWVAAAVVAQPAIPLSLLYYGFVLHTFECK